MLLMGMLRGTDAMESRMRLFQKLSAELHNPAIPFPFIYSKELESRHSSRCYTHMFISALCTIAERWKSPKWINKRWHIYIYNRVLFNLAKDFGKYYNIDKT